MSSDLEIHLSNPKPGHTTGGSGRSGARRGSGSNGVGQDGTPTDPFALKKTVPFAFQCFPSIENNCPGGFFGNTNKRIPT